MKKSTVTHFWETSDGNGGFTKIPIPLMTDAHVLKTHYLLRESIFLMSERVNSSGGISTRKKLFKEKSREWIEKWIGRFDAEIEQRKLKPKKISKHEYLSEYRKKLMRRTKYFASEKRKGLYNLGK